MSELQPENYPNAAGNIDQPMFESASLAHLLEERTARISQFFRTEIGAFSLLQTITQEQERTIGPVKVMTNGDGTFWTYPVVDDIPDPSDSSQRRAVSVAFHTNLGGEHYPRIHIREDPADRKPIEKHIRHEFIIATEALKGHQLKLTDGTDIVSTLMGPPNERGQILFDRQQRYIQWVERLAGIMEIPRTRRMHQFKPKDMPSAN